MSLADLTLNIPEFRQAIRRTRKIIQIDVIISFNNQIVEKHKIHIPPPLHNDQNLMLLNLLHLVGNRINEITSIACIDTTFRIPFMQPLKVYDMCNEINLQQISKFKSHLKKCICNDVHLRAQEIQKRIDNCSVPSWLDAEDSD